MQSIHFKEGFWLRQKFRKARWWGRGKKCRYFYQVALKNCRDFDLSRFCTCRDFVRVEILSVSRFCPVEILSCRGYVCRGFVRVEILSVSRFCPCRDFVPVEIMSCRGYVLSRLCLSRFCPSTLFSGTYKHLFYCTGISKNWNCFVGSDPRSVIFFSDLCI